MTRVFALLVPALLVLLAPRLAVAGDECQPPDGVDPYADASLAKPNDAGAEAHRQLGRKYHRATDYETAIKEFTAGYVAEPAPVFLYSIAQSYRGARNYEQAIAEYRLFLDSAQPRPGQVLRALVECFIGSMQAELDHAAATSSPTDTPPGDGGEAAHVELDVPTRSAAPWYADTPGWIVLGGGGVLGGVSAVLLLDASSLREQATTEDREDVRRALRTRADTRQLWGYVVGGVGVVALVVGVVKLAITPDAPRRHERGVVLVPGPGDLGLGLVARF